MLNVQQTVLLKILAMATILVILQMEVKYAILDGVVLTVIFQIFQLLDVLMQTVINFI
jgi:hypothetical protein